MENRTTLCHSSSTFFPSGLAKANPKFTLVLEGLFFAMHYYRHTSIFLEPYTRSWKIHGVLPSVCYFLLEETYTPTADVASKKRFEQSTIVRK